eukprot:10846732-Alexandrium_andersonii.AAC.1
MPGRRTVGRTAWALGRPCGHRARALVLAPPHLSTLVLRMCDKRGVAQTAPFAQTAPLYCSAAVLKPVVAERGGSANAHF